jgi:signal transduction histidine kinase
MDSMFDIAQIDTRTLQVHLTPVDTASLIREVSSALERSLRDRNQNLTIDIPALPLAKADPNLLKKLLLHLLTNAIKFTPNDGKIGIVARSLPTRSAELPHGGIEIVVSDTGVGVDPAAQDVIFSKFYQPGDLSKHSTSKTRFQGSGAGLGLALSKGIVEAHGGRIWVESKGYDELNCPGSKFHVILPLSHLSRNEEAPMGIEVKTFVGVRE